MRGSRLIGRALLAGAALLAAGWLAVAFVNDRALTTAAEAAYAAPPAARARQADERLREVERARFLNPDAARVEVLRSTFELFAQRPERARRILEQLVREEPENAGAWVVLAGFTRRSDPERSAQAARRARALDPLSAPR